MIKRLLFFWLLFSISIFSSSQSVRASDQDFLTTYLSLFSAHAVKDGVKLNWSLDQQSPTLTKFRIYRGYEEVGNFAVLTEVPASSGTDSVDYSITDKDTRALVSYYYKIAGVSQSGESVFPVVISATPTLDQPTPTSDLPPVALLTGEKITLYVRKSGQVKLELRGSNLKALVNDQLRPGIYEFEPTGLSGSNTKLRVTYESDYFQEVSWPVK